jgi:hypothetical protein
LWNHFNQLNVYKSEYHPNKKTERGVLMKHRRIGIILGGLAILTAAFLLLNFHMAVSNNRVDSSISTTSIGERLPDAMQHREKITIAVAGEGPLVSALQRALILKMRQAGIGNVELAQDFKPVYQNPVLLVTAGDQGVIWTPFFATSQFSIRAGYASNGDTTSPLVYDNRNGPALNMSAEFEVNDRSWGILSRPGYYQILAESLAQTIVEATKNLYKK